MLPVAHWTTRYGPLTCWRRRPCVSPARMRFPILQKHLMLGRNEPKSWPCSVVLISACALLATVCGARWNDQQRAAVLARAQRSSCDHRSAVGRLGLGPGKRGVGRGPSQGTPPARRARRPRVGRQGASLESRAWAARAGPAAGRRQQDRAHAGPALMLRASPTTRSRSARSRRCRARCPGSARRRSPRSGPTSPTATPPAACAAASSCCGPPTTASTTAATGPLVTEMASQVLGLVGGLGGGDGGGADVVEANELPVVTTADLRERSRTPRPSSTSTRRSPTCNAVIGKYRYLYDQGVRTAALVYIAVDQTRSEMQDKQKPPDGGGRHPASCNEQELPLSTLSFDSAGPRRGQQQGRLPLLPRRRRARAPSMAQVDGRHRLQAEVRRSTSPPTARTSSSSPATAAEGAMSWIRSLPERGGGGNAEQAAFLEWMDRTAPGVAADTFAADSWAAPRRSSTPSRPCPARSPGRRCSPSSAATDRPTTPAASSARSSSAPS